MIDPRIIAHLRNERVAHAVIGAVALGVHGAPRYSSDLDILVVDTNVLSRYFWSEASIDPSEQRRGDWDDPIAGLVTFPTKPGEIPAELVVGKGYAAQLALETAKENSQLECPVVSPLGLALLKLEAGGTRDIHDLLALDEAQSKLTGWNLTEAVEPHIHRLSMDAQRAWGRLQAIMPPRIEPPKPVVLPAPPVAPKVPPKEDPGSRGRSR